MPSNISWFVPTMKFMNFTAHSSSADLMATSTLSTTCSKRKQVGMRFVRRNFHGEIMVEKAKHSAWKNQKCWLTSCSSWEWRSKPTFMATVFSGLPRSSTNSICFSHHSCSKKYGHHQNHSTRAHLICPEDKTTKCERRELWAAASPWQ